MTMKIVIANTVGKLSNGKIVVPFPSRWDWAGDFDPGFRYYPYELAYLSALLKRELPDASVQMIDFNIYKYDRQQCADVLEAMSPDVFITECSALTAGEMIWVSHQTPIGKTFILGPNSGEYEWDICKKLVPGFSANNIGELDWLPWPEDENISRAWYSECSNPVPGMIQVFPTRGCPLACSFCAVPLYYGGHGNSHHSHRTRNIDNVCDEIEYLAGKYSPSFSGCFFNEETHNGNMPWLRSFANRLIDRGLGKYAYDAMCGYWGFEKEDIALLSKAGYKQLRVGIESLSPEVGRAVHKTVFRDKLVRFMEWCREHGIRVYGTTQVGAPGSTWDADLATLNQLWEWHHQGLIGLWQKSISTPQPGTPFFHEAKEKGWLLTEDFSRYKGAEPVVSFPDYPADRIAAMKMLYDSVVVPPGNKIIAN
jgi:anaerobic magnesium-protoporphyrin IX monomethyl ester cyclase